MLELSESQVADLRALQKLCDQLGADLVVIGAVAYQVHFPDEERHTLDVDFAVALDLDDFALLRERLVKGGWTRDRNHEQRWRSSKGTYLDLIPAGPKLREAKQITWPESEFRMSLVGFGHVFSSAEPRQLAENLTLKVIPPVVLMLLKVVAFMDDQARRHKDLDDIRSLLRHYEEDSDRLFEDAVIEADLPDISLGPAFLLGADLRALLTDEEVDTVSEFFKALEETNPAWAAFVRAGSVVDHAEEEARAEIEWFLKGFAGGTKS